MSTISSSTTSTTAYKVTADTTGTLVFQTGATPTTAMTLGTDQSVTIAGTLGVTGKITSASMPVGSVLQVVNASYSTIVTTSSTSYVATGLTATITPKFSTSKILVLINHACCRKSVSNANNAIDMKLQKNSSDLLQIISSGGYTGTTIDVYFTVSYVYLDSPATTSATTYSTTFRNQSASANVSVQTDGSVAPSTITLMEIAA
jgi:hypothetical protein